MSAFWQDVTCAARGLRKAPGFTFSAVLVLALGIGANGATFSLVDAALVRPLPFAHPERLVMLWERSTRFARNSPYIFSRRYPATLNGSPYISSRWCRATLLGSPGSYAPS